MPLPSDQLYCPKLQCAVYDNIFKGWNQPLLGTFTIPIGDILFGKQAEAEEDVENLEKIVTEIENIINQAGVPTYTAASAGGGGASAPSNQMFDDSEFKEMQKKMKAQVGKNLLNRKKNLIDDEEEKVGGDASSSLLKGDELGQMAQKQQSSFLQSGAPSPRTVTDATPRSVSDMGEVTPGGTKKKKK